MNGVKYALAEHCDEREHFTRYAGEALLAASLLPAPAPLLRAVADALHQQLAMTEEGELRQPDDGFPGLSSTARRAIFSVRSRRQLTQIVLVIEGTVLSHL